MGTLVLVFTVLFFWLAVASFSVAFWFEGWRDFLMNG